jgi:CRP-like cAMP-binding protein
MGMTDEQYKLLVAGNPLFMALDEAAREEVIKLARVVNYSRGDVIIQQGEEGEDIYLVRQGSVDIRTLEGGFIVELTTLGPGSLVGEVAEVSNVRRTATVVANGQVEALRFPGPALVTELRKHPAASDLLDQIVLKRAQDTIKKTLGDDEG